MTSPASEPRGAQPVTEHHAVVVVGGGMTADAAARSLHELDGGADVLVLGEEATAPFPRPALSKGLWTDPSATIETSDLDTAGTTGAIVRLETRVTGVDPDAHTVTCADGAVIGYDRLLLATGGHPRTIEGLDAGERVLYYRTLADYRRLRAATADAPHVAVVGGGYIGSEVAAALVQQGCAVTVVHPETVLGGSMFPPELAYRFDALFADAGVRQRPAVRVDSGTVREDGVDLDLSDGTTLSADLVVVGLGIEPATGFLAGVVDLDDAGGVLVDERLATSAPDVWAAGDVASYPDPVLGRTRVEHVDNATSMGAAAGRIIGGSAEVYDHTPMFYSDVLGLGYEGVGTLDPSLETYVDVLDDQAGVAVAYYLDASSVRGVLLWNGAEGLDAATALIASGRRPAAAEALAGAVH